MNKSIISASTDLNQAKGLNGLRVQMRDSAAVAESQAKTAEALGGASTADSKHAAASEFDSAAQSIEEAMGRNLRSSMTTLDTTAETISESHRKTDNANDADDTDDTGEIDDAGETDNTDRTDNTDKIEAADTSGESAGISDSYRVSAGTERLSDEETAMIRNRLASNMSADSGSLIDQYI